MNKYDIIQVWIGGNVVELTSTDIEVLQEAITFSQKTLNLSTNKFELKRDISTNRLINVVVNSLDEPMERFMYFWSILAFLTHKGWEPIATTGDAFTLKFTYKYDSKTA